MFLLFRLLPFLAFYGAVLFLPGLLVVQVMSPEQPAHQRASSILTAGVVTVFGMAALLRLLFHTAVFGRPLMVTAALFVAVPCLIILRRRRAS